MYRRLLVFSCKLLMGLLRVAGKNGSALPGLIIERLNPDFLQKTLGRVEKKVFIITGTNGKTTTTKMLVSSLRGLGCRVVTNSTGSNMTRGLIAALVDDMTIFGNLKETDWFVFEMDEAYAPIFTTSVSPKMLVGLNVLRDQLDRYGEINTTARMIGAAAERADIFVSNSVDPLLREIAENIGGNSGVSFGVAKDLLPSVTNEQSLGGSEIKHMDGSADVVLSNLKPHSSGKQKITLRYKNDSYNLSIPLKGFHNALNAAAVVASLVAIDSFSQESLDSLSDMPIPFGRGELLSIKGKNITVALVKNPSGFISNLETFVKNQNPEAILFVVNDRVADGRDVSWLWDVDFKKYIRTDGPVLYTAGIRGLDMAVRLRHDGLTSVNIGQSDRAVRAIIRQKDYKDILIIPTYTALFEVRQELSKYGKVPKIW